MRAERCVVDTNVLISALLKPSGPPAEVLDAIRTAGGVLLFSDETFAELTLRLMRPKFDRYVDQALRWRFLPDLGLRQGGSRSQLTSMPVAIRTTTSSSGQQSMGRPIVSSAATPTFWCSTHSKMLRSLRLGPSSRRCGTPTEDELTPPGATEGLVRNP